MRDVFHATDGTSGNMQLEPMENQEKQIESIEYE